MPESYACPSCHGDALDVQITTWARLTQNRYSAFDDDPGLETDTSEAQFQDHEWDEGSLMQCRECGHVEKASAFQVTDESPTLDDLKADAADQIISDGGAE